MKTYWVFWWGRTANPLRQLNRLHWVGVILVVLFFAAYCWLPPRLFIRVLTCTVVIAPIWGYWVSRVKKMATPFNLLVPQLRRRLLKTSIAHWLIATLLFAFAATIRERLDFFFSIGLLTGCSLLAFAWLASLRNIWLVAVGGIVLVFCGWLSAAFLRLDDHPGIATVILVPGWLVMPVLAWLAINILLDDGAARQLKVGRLSRKVSFRDAVHHWFLRRMAHACANTALRPEVLARVRLEARLNFSFGRDFHWSSFYVSWFFGVFVFYTLLLMRNDASSPVVFWFKPIVFFIFAIHGNIYLFWDRHRNAPTAYRQTVTVSYWDTSTTIIANSDAVLMKGLLFLAPGLPQGLALHQARARISLRYFLIVWAGCVTLYALAFSGLGAGLRDHAVLMIATAELAVVGNWVGSSRYQWSEPGLLAVHRLPGFFSLPIDMFIRLIWPTISTKYVWFLFMFAPSWYIESISLPLWTASCLLGGGAFLYLRWQKLATEPDGLPAEWR